MKKTEKTWLYVFIGTIAVVVALFIWFGRRPQRTSCDFDGWKRTVGVDIAVVVKNLEVVKGQVGLSDADVREFDAIQKDFVIKYEAACRDVSASPPRMNQGEYSCRRGNMDRVLDSIRTLVEASKNVNDAGAKKEVVLRALNDMREVSQTEYRTGCTSAMNVTPKTITFHDGDPERSVDVINFGNNDFTFSILDLPESFLPKVNKFSVTRGESIPILIFRTLMPLPKGQLVRFHVRNNLRDDVEVTIVLDAVNAALYENWGTEIQAASQISHREPTVEDALRVVERSLPQELSPTDRDVLGFYFAAGALTKIGKGVEARRALDIAVSKDPSLERQPATQMLRGIALYHEGESDRALRAFADAKQLAGPTETEIKSSADLFSGAVLLKRGDQARAAEHLDNINLQRGVDLNPDLLSFAEREFETPGLGTVVRKASPVAGPSDDAKDVSRPERNRSVTSSPSWTSQPRAEKPSPSTSRPNAEKPSPVTSQPRPEKTPPRIK